MPTQDQIVDEIETLEQLLSAGATSITSDGETVQLNESWIRRRLAELRGMQQGTQHRNRRVRTLDISNAH